MNTALLKARGWIRGPWWEPAAYCALVAVAAAMRLWDLGSRALHHDESLHAQYAWNLYTGEGFRHDPMMHGPFQMEAIAGVFFALGDSDYTARLVSAAAGIALVALPFFFRARLGRIGALLTSAMLAFSPTLLYFSRFARNDVIMAVWALGLVISMWRYLDEGKPRYLYAASVFLALAFTTKETAYLLVAVLGIYLAGVVAARNWAAVTRGITAEEVSPPEALGKAAATAWSNLKGMLTFNGVSRETGFFILLVTLSMPLWSAMVGILQETPLLSWSGLTLASPAGGPGPIGAPARGGFVIAFFVAAAMTGLAVVGGVKWNRTHWWRYALVFWAIWIVIQTTFFTHLGGAGSGLWQSLGYWVAQQDVARGDQPWYYYLVITPVYEHLPLVLAIAGGVFYIRRGFLHIWRRSFYIWRRGGFSAFLAFWAVAPFILLVLTLKRRRDKFGAFLAFWAAGSFFLYSMAGEKMPWLLVNLTLPMIVLAGKFLGDVVRMVQWRHAQALLVLLWVPVFAVVAWSLAYVDFDLDKSSDAVMLGVLLVALAAAAALGVWLVRRLGRAAFAAPAAVSLAVLLLAVGMRAGWVLSYENGDSPVELAVYTQTSPDIPGLVRHLEATVEDEAAVTVAVDQTRGFAWPWRWYFRDYYDVRYVAYDGQAEVPRPDAQLLVVHSENKAKVDEALDGSFPHVVRIQHRRWFPETYKGTTLGGFAGSLFDRGDWRMAMDYFLHRKAPACEYCSEDAYVYFSSELPSGFTPAE